MVTTPLVVMTGFGDERLAVDIMKSGAVDYIVKSATVFEDMPAIARKALRFWENLHKRLRAENAERESQKRLADILSFMPDPVLAIDNNGTVIAWNNAMEGLSSIPSEDMLGKDDHEYSIPFYGERRPILIDLVLENDPEIRKKYSYVNTDGQKIIAETFCPKMNGGKGAHLWGTASPLFDAAGKRAGAIEVIRDISDRKKTEMALQESETRFRDLFNNMSAGVAVYIPTPDGEDFIIRDVNHAVETIDHVRKDEITGRRLLEVFPGVRQFGLFDVLRRVAKTGVAESFPVSLYQDNRISGWRDNYVYRLQSGEVVALYEDVTEKKQAEEDNARLLTTVKEDKEKLSVLLNSIVDEVWFTDLNHHFVLANPRALNEFRLDPAQSTTVETLAAGLEIRRPDGTPRPVEEAPPLRAIAGEVLHGMEEIVRTPATGELRYRQVSAAPVRGPDGSIIGSVSVARDITGQKQAEDNLRESEEKAKSLMNVPIMGAFIIDREGMLLDVNETVLKGYGKTAEDILGTSVWNLFSPPVAKRRKEWVEEAIRTKEMVRFEDKNEGRYHDTVIMPLADSHGEVRRLAVVAFDITVQKAAQEALADSEERYRALLFSAGIGVTYWSPDGNLLFINEISLKRLNRKEGDVIGKNVREIFGDTDGEIYLEHICKAVTSPEAIEHEGYISLSSGNGWFLSVFTRITGPDGTVRGVQLLSMDITGRKQAEVELKKNEIQLREAMDLAQLVNWEFDALTGIFTFNDRFYSLYGTTAEQEGGYQMPAEVYAREFVYPDDQYLVGEEVNKALVTTDPQFESRVEHRIVRRDGEVRTIIVRFGIIKDADGRTVKTFGANQDITERKRMEYTLQESERKFRTVADHTYDWEYWILPNGKYAYISPSCERITGYPPEEFTRDPEFLNKIIYPDDGQIISSHVDSIAKEDDSEGGIEFRIMAKSGNIVWIGHICRPLFDSQGVFMGRRGSNRDITKRKRAEEALQKSEIRFRAMIQNSSDLIRILDHGGRIIYESPSSTRILGYPPDSMIGRDPMEFIHPDDIERVKRDLQEVFDTVNTGTPSEFRIRKADGEYIWVDSIATNLLEVPGVNGIVITTRPIQQRKEAEQALHQSEERLRLSLEGADAGFWDWHLPTGQAVFSDRFYTMLGYEPGEFPATFEGWNALMHPDDRDRILQNLMKQIREKQPQLEIEYRIRAKEGNWVWLLGRGKIVDIDNEGNPLRMTGVNIDITNRRMMESEIRSLNAVLEQRVKDRTEALSLANTALEKENTQRLDAEAKIRSALEEKTILLKEVHHRVKNNLQIIVSLLNLQSRYIKDEPTLAAIRESQNRVKAMALVHEKLYRAEDIAHIDLNDYIKFLGTGLFQFYDAKSRGIQFRRDISGVGVDINTAIPLGLIINELISNSLKYAFPEGRTGEVCISVQSSNHDVTVLFRDNGVGIPGDFDWRNTPSLGLRLVNSLVDQLNGTIELDRSAGTLFTIVLHERG